MEFGTVVKRMAAAAALTALAACGGGGNSSPGPEYAEGLWAGSTSTSGTLDGVFLDDGRYWLVFGANGVARSMITGSGRMRGSVFRSDNGADFYFGQTPAYASTLAAEVNPQAAMTGQMYIANILEGFDLRYVPSYDRPASPNEIIGNWQGSASTLQTLGTLAISIAPGGTFTATLSGCNYGGTIQPNRNGRNVFDFFFLTTNPSQICPAFRVDGVMVSGSGRLVFTGTTPDRSDAFYAVVQ
jgi:hypothetical protein